MSHRTLEHRQLPLRTTLVEAQNVQIAIVAFDLEVAIVWSEPLIDVFLMVIPGTGMKTM